MPSIYIAASILTLGLTGIYAALLMSLAPKELRKSLLLLALFELPMEPLSFIYCRMPMDGVIKAVIEVG